MVLRAAATLILIHLTGFPTAAAAEDTYYMVLFASRNRPLSKPRAHCFASFVKITAPELPTDSNDKTPSPKDESETFTISWYPHGERCRLFRAPEPGRNADLTATLSRCARNELLLYKWGPYQIEPGLYELALQQKCRLEEGQLLWQAIDRSSRSDGIALNCVHAVSDIDVSRGRLRLGVASGDKACAQIAHHLHPWFIHPEQKHDWVLDLLPLEGEEVVDCPLEPCALDYSRD